MGLRGPAKQPTALRKMKGNPSNRPLPTDEPKPKAIAADDDFAAPDHLNAEAAAEWKRIVAGYRGTGLFASVDRAALSTYCVLWSAHVEAVRAINAGGVLKAPAKPPPQSAKSKSKTPPPAPKIVGEVVSPYFRIMRETAEQMRAYMREMGLTPASRAAMGRGDGTPPAPKPPGEETPAVDAGEFGDLIPQGAPIGNA